MLVARLVMACAFGFGLQACHARSSFSDGGESGMDGVQPLAIARRAPGTGLWTDAARREVPFKEISCRAFQVAENEHVSYLAVFETEEPPIAELRVTLNSRDLPIPEDELAAGRYRSTLDLNGRLIPAELTLESGGARGSVATAEGTFVFQCFTTDHTLRAWRKPGRTTLFDDCYRARSRWEKLWCALDPNP